MELARSVDDAVDSEVARESVVDREVVDPDASDLALAHQELTNLARESGEVESEKVSDAARKAEPDSLYVRSIWAFTPSYGKHYQRAGERMDELLSDHPDFLIAQYFSALVYGQAGRWADAIHQTAAAMRAAPEEPFFLGLYGQALRGGGRSDEADEIVERLEAMRESRYVSGSSLAQARIGSEDPRDCDALIESLVRALEGREPLVPMLLPLNYWDPYRDDPRIQAALERSGISSKPFDEPASGPS